MNDKPELKNTGVTAPVPATPVRVTVVTLGADGGTITAPDTEGVPTTPLKKGTGSLCIVAESKTGKVTVTDSILLSGRGSRND